MAEKASMAERRANALGGEMEEARALLDSAERGKRALEAELGDARNAVNEMTAVNTRANNEKRRRAWRNTYLHHGLSLAIMKSGNLFLY